MLARDIAEVIIGAWINGDHLEDVKLIPVNDFGDEDLVKLAKVIREGETDMIQITRKAKASPTDVVRIMGMANETMYQSALANIERQRVKEWLTEHQGDDPESIIDYLQKHTRRQPVSVPDLPDLSDQLVGYRDILEKRRTEKNMLTGLKPLDDMTVGIHKGHLTALGARPSTGKSSMALQVATNVAGSGCKVIFFSLEMSAAENIDRMCMRYMDTVDQRALRSGELTETQWDEFGRVSEKLAGLAGNLTFMHDRSLSVIERIIEKHRPDLVVIDQLTQLTEPTLRFADVRGRFSHMTSNLKRIAMEHNVAVWLCCQLNRQVSGSTKPSMDYLKESGSIEEDSDIVILLSRDEAEEEARGLEGNRVVNVNVAKQRGGPQGEFQTKFVVKRFQFRMLEEMPDPVPEGFYESQEELPFEEG